VQGARRSPIWARLLVIAGAVLLLTSGTAIAGVVPLLHRYEGAIDQRDLFGELNPGAADRGPHLTGPLNILLAGLDTRPSRPHEPPRADAIMIVHITADLERAYLLSIPRDSLVDIPAYEATGYLGGRGRINSAMSIGSRQQPGEELPDIGRGFELLSRTVADLTGIAHFDAGAVINFTGFTDVVDALDGISLELDERIVSQHRQPNGRHRPVNASGQGYHGPQMVYEPGTPPCGFADAAGVFRCDLEGWQALDIARQRYGVGAGDYGRQRNQQRVLVAIMDKALSLGVASNPVRADQALRAAGESLTFDGRGVSPVDFAFALRHLRPRDVVTLQVEGTPLGVGNAYRGEELTEDAHRLFAAVAGGRLDEFLLANRDFLD
jgi:polyisoprenyl-teichoic acid--peptidoglycan teichoic acid transferase